MEKETNYYNQIKDLLIDNEIYQRVKDYSKERNKVITYYEIGKILNAAGKQYGENIIEKYSEKLINEGGGKYSTTLLKRMRQLYIMFQNSAPMAHLSWSHYQELLPLKDINKIKYYIQLCINEHLSRNKLRERIKSKEYERLDEKTIGLIIPRKNNRFVIEYSSDSRITFREYIVSNV